MGIFRKPLTSSPISKTNPKKMTKLIIDLLWKWFLVYYYYGDFKGLTELASFPQRFGRIPRR